MRELALRVRADAVEEVLDVLLPLAERGVFERPRGEEVELAFVGAELDLPDEDAARGAAGDALRGLELRTVADDWRERRAAGWRPLVVADRLEIRPDWAQPSAPGLPQVALADSPAFGGGTHPTTVLCLGLLAEMEPRGSFADLGCGSGVLALAAARLGWHPVIAVDAHRAAVHAALANAALNDIELDGRRVDLGTEQPPPASAAAANVPPPVHAALAPRLDAAVVVASGFGDAEAPAVEAAYGAVGFATRQRRSSGEWVALELARS